MKRIYNITRTALKNKKVKDAVVKTNGSMPKSRDSSALVAVLKKLSI